MCEQCFLKVQCVTVKLLNSFNLKRINIFQKGIFPKISVVVKSAVGQ